MIIPFCHEESEITLKGCAIGSDRKNDSDSKEELFMSKFLALGKDVAGRDELKYEQLPFYHPLFIMYSSGTTGKPKCIVSSKDIIFFYQLWVLKITLTDFRVFNGSIKSSLGSWRRRNINEAFRRTSNPRKPN